VHRANSENPAPSEAFDERCQLGRRRRDFSAFLPQTPRASVRTASEKKPVGIPRIVAGGLLLAEGTGDLAGRSS
jgi:hypothetical protein